MRMRYRSQSVFAQLNLLDSHDVSRFLSLCTGERRKYELAVLFQMTFPGMPSIFYGDELGVEGIREEEYRQPMPWGKQDPLLDFYKKAVHLRKKETALRRGSFRTISAESGSRLYGYERVWQENYIRVILNMEEKHVQLCKDWLQGNMLEAYGFIVTGGQRLCR